MTETISKEFGQNLLELLAAKDATIAELRAEIAELRAAMPTPDWVEGYEPATFEAKTPALPV